MTKTAKVLGLFTGKAENRWDGKAPSAIRKKLKQEPLLVTETGFVEDEQADQAVHGGPEKAIHHYPFEHYASWVDAFGNEPFEYVPGAFGENISSHGFTEKDLCIGDVFALGTARAQISQGRQPCWKLNMHSSNSALASSFQKSGKTGWYYRILQSGKIQAGDEIVLVDRPCPDWNLRAVILARFNPRLSHEVAQQLAALPELAEPWRTAFAKKMDPKHREDTTHRLGG